ncbi:efflux RND transporter periplasmic adaptor subunit [Massilia sp. W12]|uniref:efflux RND transporter periplasmic adaptor subunit n=1 Tax=Massilia sp. W12 TaxID=3126507 RepID=UPI0030D52D2E
MSFSTWGQNGGGNWTLEEDAEVWRTFAQPDSDQAFCQAWLSLLCRQLPGVAAGVVLLHSDDEHTFTPAAVWPDFSQDFSFLSEVAERALREARGVVHWPEADAGSEQRLHVAYPVHIAQRVAGAVVLDVAPRPEQEVHALLRQVHWGVAWVHDLLHRREARANAGAGERIGSAMEVLATGLRQSKLQQTLFELANHIARQLGCSRVGIGMVRDGAARLMALSNAAWFEKDAPLSKHYKAAMQDVAERAGPISWQRGEDEGAPLQANHMRLGNESGTEYVHSQPLLLGAAVLAVITLERDKPLVDEEREWLETLAVLLPNIIELKRRAERNHRAHLADDLRAFGRKLFGPRHLLLKTIASVLGLTVALSVLIEIDYRVSAKTVIEGEVQRSLVAPFEGFVVASHVRPGDSVQRGQVLCELEDRELKLEQQKWQSEHDQYERKLREAMANHELSEVRILSAQSQQAQAQLNLVNERLARIKISAPFDGLIISGDLSQLIGSPVETGKKLLDIAPLQAYRVILQVDEREMRHIRFGQEGKLVISGLVGDPLTFRVSKVTPVANAADGKNFFRVEAHLTQAPPKLRPGMEGVGKISTGKQRLWWILTHSFTDWLRITLWNWLP